MLEIGLGVFLFVVIVLALVLLIVAVRARLVPSGEVGLIVNESKATRVEAGSKLLAALDEMDIHLPSACGGRGTCGQCRVQVRRGGGGILPTEKALITKREAAAGTRLACQVKVQEDMELTVADDIFGVKEWRCRVRSNENIATLIKELVLDLPDGEHIDFKAGSYVLVSCPPYAKKFRDLDIGPEYRGEWDRFDLWRYEAGTDTATARGYSMANHPGENTFIQLDVRIAIPPPGAEDDVPPGIVSSYIFGLKEGDEVTVSGPFGNFFAGDGDKEMIFIGGGVGMAPMRSHIFDQLLRKESDRKIGFWYGARNIREILYREDFERLAGEHQNFSWHVALSDPDPADGWTGMTGFIHEALYEHYLKDHPTPEDCEYFLCGPPMMVRAVRNLLDSLGVDSDNIHFDDFGG